MDINSFIEHFSDVFDETDIESFTPETHFKEEDEWSSLTALSLMAMVNEEYDVELSPDDIRNTSTIEELYNILTSKL